MVERKGVSADEEAFLFDPFAERLRQVLLSKENSESGLQMWADSREQLWLIA